jgi:hypothetical protein
MPWGLGPWICVAASSTGRTRVDGTRLCVGLREHPHAYEGKSTRQAMEKRATAG